MRLVNAVVALLLAAIVLQQAGAGRSTSAVVDEPAHLTAGYLSIARGDLGVNREHPPLLKALAALPLLAMRPVLPPPDPDGPAPGSEDFEFGYSRRFLYHANDADRLLAAARLPMILLTASLGLLVFLWARAIAGSAAGLAALAFYAFEPNVLAHGRLVTTDLGAAAFSLAFLWALRAFSRSAARPAAAAAAILLGCALLSKFSTLLLLPLGALLLLLDARLAPPTARPPLARLLAGSAAILAGAWLILEAGYRFDGFPLPGLYVEGFRIAQAKNALYEGPTYLMGAISKDGFWSYYLIALLVKTTVPLLIAAAIGAAILALLPPLRREASWILLPAIAWLGAMTFLTRAQIGLRYVLPVIPLMCLCAGAGVSILLRARGAVIVGLAFLFVWHAGAALWIYPHHLAYFNEPSGGPSRGWRWLVDSNLDWGQDLGGLAEYLRARGNPPVNLYYFGTADPDYYGIHRNSPAAPAPGLFAVSATHLAGVYLPEPDYLGELREIPPAASIGHSIFVYDLAQVPPGLRVPLARPRAAARAPCPDGPPGEYSAPHG